MQDLSMVIEPEALKLFNELKEADAADEAERVQLGADETYGGHRRAVLRDALFAAYEKGRASGVRRQTKERYDKS